MIDTITFEFETGKREENSIMYRFQDTLIYKVRQPLSLIDALSKIGGLLVILKLSAILFLVHRFFFEKRLTHDLSTQNK